MTMMNNTFILKAAFLLLLLAGTPTPGTADEKVFKDIPLSGKGVLTLVPGPAKADTVARFDKLLLLPAIGSPNPEKDGKVIFETQGATLQDLATGDLDGDGTPEILLTLDPGSGSGGFIDLMLLTASGTSYQVTWEKVGIKGGQGTFADPKKAGKTGLIVTYLQAPDPKAEPTAKTSFFQFKDGKVNLTEGENPVEETGE